MHLIFGLTLCAAIGVTAVPAPEPTAAPDLAAAVAARQAPKIINFSQLNASLSSASSGPASAFAGRMSALISAIKPSPTPTNVAALQSSMSSLARAYPSNPVAAGAALLLSGLTGAKDIIGGPGSIEAYGSCNRADNTNTRQPNRPIYPSADPNDAPYQLSEQQLRSAIYIPPEFTYGRVKPALFLPGSGVRGCMTWFSNLAKLARGSSYADPVYLNIPTNMLDDEQVNAEYIAYAINYIAGVSNQSISVLSWSGSGPVVQWVHKYWPSTRETTQDHVSISTDYDGTILAPLICPPGSPCAPAVLQQTFGSRWIRTLNANGGDGGYVPVTSIWSIFDEIVQPQQRPFASGEIGSRRGNSVTNIQVQDTCPVGTIAGGPNFGHENLLYNGVSLQNAIDAIRNSGPARTERAGPYDCNKFMAEGLTFADVFATEFLIPYAGFSIFTYPNKTTSEPPIRAYAAADAPRN